MATLPWTDILFSLAIGYAMAYVLVLSVGDSR